MPIGEEDYNHHIELLTKAGFDGYISGEWIDRDLNGVHLPRELSTLKRYEETLS